MADNSTEQCQAVYGTGLIRHTYDICGSNTAHFQPNIEHVLFFGLALYWWQKATHKRIILLSCCLPTNTHLFAKHVVQGML